MTELTRNLKPDEFRQYYFLKEELKDFCRQEGLKISGSKGDLEKRIVHYLATGEKLAEASAGKSFRKTSSQISLNTQLGENFKCSEDKREFFKGEIGNSFKFNVRFQKWLKENPEKTYGDAVKAYHEIRNSKEKTQIASQFQYNQYIRDFFEDNDDKSLKDAVACWKYKKSLKGHNRYEKSDLNILKV